MATAGKLGWVALGVLGLCAIAVPVACGGGGGGGTITPSFAASFTGSRTTVAPNVVRLRSASSSGDTVVLEVTIGGSTTSTNLNTFAFDLVLSDPSVASYVNQSATFGNALTLGAGQTAGVQVAQSGNRVIVGVTKIGAGTGNGVSVSEAVVVRLTFRVLKVGTTTVTFSGVVNAQNPSGGPAVLDPTPALVPSVLFDTVPAAISGS